MRPAVLNPLFAEIRGLKGVGPKVAKALSALAGERVVDLCWHWPSGLIDRRNRPSVMAAADGEIATLEVEVVMHEAPPNKRIPYKVRCRDDSGFVTLVFFHAREDYLQQLLPLGARRIVSGRIAHFGGEVQMAHPDHVVPPERAAEELPLLEPVYPASGQVSARVVARAAAAAVARAPDLAEWLDPAWLARNPDWPGWHEALRRVHGPEQDADLAATAPARARLAYDELLANQLALLLVRRHMRRQAGRGLNAEGRLRDRVTAALPYALTRGQQDAVAAILADLAAPQRMLRLLQGDVGSGKTVVAMLAMVEAVEAGTQAALVAPTEVLARQHAASLAPLAEAAGLRLAALTGRDRGAKRDAFLRDLVGGEIDIAIGTHALLQDDVAFRDLGLAVIDEQHRFGVQQRLALARKGQAVDVLVMTATPIPRTLTLTVYGDMDVSRLSEKPPGRVPIDTRVLPLSRLDDIVAAVRRAVGEGDQVYWVCPLVADSERQDLAAAEQRFQALQGVLGQRVGLIHGRLAAADKDAAIARFADRALDVLVATTVIEVGINVPSATVMIVEHAERFGLAQLHQLRGRVGRGDRAGRCLLLYAEPLGETARARLRTLRESDDGFHIADLDLQLRGAGDLLGTQQAGLPRFRIADLAAHADLLAVARDDARLILERDSELEGPRGEALRTLLYLFERDEAVRLFRSG